MAQWETERSVWTPGESLPVPGLWPAAMRRLADAQRAGGWRQLVSGGIDTREARWLTLDAVHDGREVKARVTWHSRATDGRSLRLFSAMSWRPYHGWCHVTVTDLVRLAATTD